MSRRLLAGAILAALLPTGAAWARQSAPADSALEARVREVAAGLRCPVCQGLSILDSPTELAQEMRAVVREQLAEGRTPAEVKEYFVSKYGEWILLEPTPEGLNLVVYLLPWLTVAAGAAVIAIGVRRWTRTGGEPDPTPPEAV
ncbi:MAG TPA: cytochrome c-type biogenesis protein CcmH [Longimicrobiales bacterium]